MSEHPLISVVIASFNAEAFIASTIQSILDQSYPNVELVLVDDGSTDDTVATVENLVGDQIPLKIFRAVNGGQNAARNIGLALCEGEFVKFLDHDDILPKWSLKSQLQLLDDTVRDIAIGGIERFDHDKEATFLATAPDSPPEPSEVDADLPAIEACETVHPTFNEILIRRDLVASVGGFNPSLGTCEELNLLSRIHLRDRKTLAAYRQSPPVLYKRCMDWSLAAHHRSRSKTHVNWALVCRTDLAKAHAETGEESDPIFQTVVLDKLYRLATISYRNGLKGHALSALEAWTACGSPRPELDPPLHDRLHRLLGFERAERLLAKARTLLGREEKAGDA